MQRRENQTPVYGDISRRRFLIVTAGTAGVALLAACGGSSAATAVPTTARVTAPAAATTGSGATPAASVVNGAASPPTAQTGQTLVVNAVEYGFQTNGSVPAGPTTIQLKNFGKEVHEVGLIRLKDGATVEQFRAAAMKDEDTAYQLGTLEGGPNRIGPQGTSEVILDLAPGQYALACFVNTADGVTHAAKGMILPLQVTAATAPATPLPTGNGTIPLGGNGSDWPATFPAGKSMYRVSNKADGVREFFVGRLATGKTADDLKRALTDPASNGTPDWFEPFGGMEGLKPGGMGIAILDLKPGSYAAVDSPIGEGEPTLKGYTVAG